MTWTSGRNTQASRAASRTKSDSLSKRCIGGVGNAFSPRLTSQLRVKDGTTRPPITAIISTAADRDRRSPVPPAG